MAQKEYRKGDSLQQIDWKASSRMRKVISREYQDERNWLKNTCKKSIH